MPEELSTKIKATFDVINKNQESEFMNDNNL